MNINPNSSNKTDIENFKKQLGRNIKLLRMMSGLTGEDFAKSIGVSRNHLYCLERGTAYGIVIEALFHINNRTNISDLLNEDITKKYFDLTYRVS